METTERTDLSLEFTNDNAARGDVRRQVTDICVSCLGLSASEVQGLFEGEGTFLVSAMKPDVDLASLISNLEALGVLVRSSPSDHQDRKSSRLRPTTRRAALYSSRYGDLLGAHDMQPMVNASSTRPQPRRRIPSIGLALVIVAVLVSVGIPSSRYWSTRTGAKNWTIDDFRPTSWGDGSVSVHDSGEPPATFRGSASLAGMRILSQVSRNGNEYSARFMAQTSDEAPSPLRIEGEPVFLASQGNEYSATTTYTMTDPSGGFRTGSARIQVTLNTEGAPEQAHVTLDLPDELTRLTPGTNRTVTFSVDLLPG